MEVVLLNPWQLIFLIAIPLLLRRAPLPVGRGKPAAGISFGSATTKEISKTKAADPPSEPAKAAAVVEKNMVTLSGAPPLIVDRGSRDADVSDVAMTPRCMGRRPPPAKTTSSPSLSPKNPPKEFDG